MCWKTYKLQTIYDLTTNVSRSEAILKSVLKEETIVIIEVTD